MQRACLVLVCLACGGRATGDALESGAEPPGEVPPYRTAEPAGVASPTGGGSPASAAPAGDPGTGGGAARSSGAAVPPEPPRALPEACNTLRQLDPGEVYLLGTVQEGSCGFDALAHWSNPDVALTGFGCHNHPGAARISSDRTLIISDAAVGVTLFHEDACVTRQEGWFGNGQFPLANDGEVAFPCAQPSTHYDNLLALAPSGDMAFWCGAGWFSSSGQLLYLGSSNVLAFDGTRLLTFDSLVDVAARGERRLELPPGAVLTTRVTSDGFWLVLEGAQPDAAALWHVAHDAQLELVGAYPAPPARAIIQYSSRLAGDGTLFQLATDRDSEYLSDLIVRRTLSGSAEVVYDEADSPLVRIHGSSLVTGP